MDISKYESLAAKLKVLGHPVRLCIVNGILKKRCLVKQISETLGLPQPVIHRHISKLKAAGIISAKRQGRSVKYNVIDHTVIKLLSLLTK